jgi:hypothetical protein
LEECVYVLNAIRGQCFESLCWNTGLTGRLIVGKFSDMFLYFSNRRTRTQCIKSGALGNVIKDGELNRCIIMIVYFVTMCMEDLKVCCRCGGNVASGGVTKVEVSRGTVMSGGALFQHADSVPRFFGTAAHGMFAGLDSKLVEISFFGLSLNAVVMTMGCVPVVIIIPTNNLITSTLKGILTSININIIITLQHRKTQNLHTTSLSKQ